MIKRSVAHNRSEKLPIPFDADGTFIPIEASGMSFSKQGKGVLDMIRLRGGPNPAIRGDIRLRFLHSRTYPTHSDMLRAAGYGVSEQPILEAAWGADRYKLAARYTTRPGRRAPLEMGLMIAAADQGRPVEDMRSYQKLRQAVAVASGYIIAEHEFRRDAPGAMFELTVTENFMTPRDMDVQKISANNLQELAVKLGPS